MPRVARRPSRHVRLGVGIVSTLALAGCFTGERPTLLDRPEVDDPATQAVLDRLDLASSTEFGATYEITPTLTGQTTVATVTQSGDRREIVIGDVSFVTDGTIASTCLDGDRACVDYVDDARVSDLNVTHLFWGDAFATRLELDAARRIGFTSASDATIAGQPAACVDIPVPTTSELSGTVRYCALDAGVLGRYVGADVEIELTAFTSDPGDPDL